MTDLSAVPDQPQEDPKTGRERPTSDVQFPYYDLRTAIEVAETIHNKAGGSCDREQLASILGHKAVRSGAFVSKVSAVKMFGLIEEEGDTIRLTHRARNIVAKITEEDAKRAKVDAFLDVELFRRVYERFQGNSLPPEVGLRNLMETQYGIVQSRVAATVRVMLDSAEEAGFFEITGNRTQMVKPLVKKSSDSVDAVDTATDGGPDATNGPEGDQPPHGGGGGNGSGHGGGGGTIHPALYGLLSQLPEPGTPLGEKRRQALINALTSFVNFIYPEKGE